MQVTRAGFVINTELYSKTIENVFSELVTSAVRFLLIVLENFPESFTSTDHDQAYTDTNTFQRCLCFAAFLIQNVVWKN